ncbi:plasmid transfer protein TraA [Streptomyces sp. NPDC058240]|uniref:plasmid transfer protein TraA n=1 Tax=Streptomyces sp. NPDC058240 TaxID=3346396 RepID=UPI0036EEB8C4
MTTPANDSTSYGPGPRPVGEPSFPRAQQERATRGAAHRTTHKTRVGGGFNPSLNLTVNEKVAMPHSVGQPGTPGAQQVGGGKVPGSDFMSNEDIRAYCEHYRKRARNLATEMAMDADHLEAVLRTIPDPAGALGGSRARARRVTRWLKKASAAQKAQQKYFASLYGTFEREFESNLRSIKARQQQKPARTFGWR